MCFDKSREEEKKTAITFTENPEIFVSLAGKKIENSAVQRNCEIKTNRRRMKRIENGLKWTSLSRKKKLRKILERHWEFMIISNVFFLFVFDSLMYRTSNVIYFYSIRKERWSPLIKFITFQTVYISTSLPTI